MHEALNIGIVGASGGLFGLTAALGEPITATLAGVGFAMALLASDYDLRNETMRKVTDARPWAERIGERCSPEYVRGRS